jgi:hypothetical protein
MVRRMRNRSVGATARLCTFRCHDPRAMHLVQPQGLGGQALAQRGAIRRDGIAVVTDVHAQVEGLVASLAHSA